MMRRYPKVIALQADAELAGFRQALYQMRCDGRTYAELAEVFKKAHRARRQAVAADHCPCLRGDEVAA